MMLYLINSILAIINVIIYFKSKSKTRWLNMFASGSAVGMIVAHLINESL